MLSVSDKSHANYLAVAVGNTQLTAAIVSARSDSYNLPTGRTAP